MEPAAYAYSPPTGRDHIPVQGDRAGILAALGRLDDLLARAVAAAQQAYGPQAQADPFRGLHIDPQEVEALFARPPGQPLLYASGNGPNPSGEPSEDPDSPIPWLVRAYDLTPFDVDVLLLALAPEVDLRYERLFAYLQDDVSHRRPGVDLALNILCASTEDKLGRRSHFLPQAPLLRHRLVHLIPSPHQAQPPLLAHDLKLDDQVVGLLLGLPGLDTRLGSFVEQFEPLDSPAGLPLEASHMAALQRLLDEGFASGEPVILYFHGPPGAGKRRTAKALATRAGNPLLVADMRRFTSTYPESDEILDALLRAATFNNALLFIDNLEALEASTYFPDLTHRMSRAGCRVILSSTNAWAPVDRQLLAILPIAFPIPGAARRHQYWRAALEPDTDRNYLEALAERFRLTPGQIANAATLARNQARWRAANQPSGTEPAIPTEEELFAAARAQSGQALAELAHKVQPLYTWADIVLPDDSTLQLQEICQRVLRRAQVLEEWGFDRKISLGKGVNALFSGPSGTGKTMAAEIIANELQLDLYKIDLSGVVSKYIGETEKNLDRIFTAAENANAILFFDEADALFGKRSEVRDSHDRYANIEISYLLQKMEQYEGITILATNLRQNLDESFVRRLAFTVHFPFPDAASRRYIWAGIWPDEVPLADNIDFDFLAGQFKLSGGNIKNISLAAAFLAAEAGMPVSMVHLIHAIRREYQKVGKGLSSADLKPYEKVLQT